jgi:hypothetical protein
VNDDDLLDELAAMAAHPAEAAERVSALDADDVAALLVVAATVLHRALGSFALLMEVEPEPAFAPAAQHRHAAPRRRRARRRR